MEKPITSVMSNAKRAVKENSWRVYGRSRNLKQKPTGPVVVQLDDVQLVQYQKIGCKDRNRSRRNIVDV